MSNIRLFFSESLSLKLNSKLDKSKSHYISKVMRIKSNETFSFEDFYKIISNCLEKF